MLRQQREISALVRVVQVLRGRRLGLTSLIMLHTLK